MLVGACASRPPAAPEHENEGPTRCTKDADCSPPPCGPCDPNTAIKASMMVLECVTNPCPSPAAYCTPDHVCAVR